MKEKIQLTIRGNDICKISKDFKENLKEGMSLNKMTWYKTMKLSNDIFSKLLAIEEKFKTEIGVSGLNFIQILELIENTRFSVIMGNGIKSEYKSMGNLFQDKERELDYIYKKSATQKGFPPRALNKRQNFIQLNVEVTNELKKVFKIGIKNHLKPISDDSRKVNDQQLQLSSIEKIGV